MGSLPLHGLAFPSLLQRERERERERERVVYHQLLANKHDWLVVTSIGCSVMVSCLESGWEIWPRNNIGMYLKGQDVGISL